MSQESSSNARPRVKYHGPAKLGDRQVMCAVLEDGRRGYVQRSFRQAIGINQNLQVPGLTAFCAEIAPNALKYMTKAGSPFEVTMPGHGRAYWVEAGILAEVAGGVLNAAIDGKLRANRKHLVQPCLQIMTALAHVGEVALIDEATGYQANRPDNALQDLYTKLIRQTALDWERRFHPDYYAALCKLFGIRYEGKHRPLPSVIGKITMDWVYDAIFPKEIIAEIKSRQKSEKLHQWLQSGGLNLLEKQRDAVMMIARSSVDYRDFEARCSVAFYKPGLQTKMNFPQLPN